MYHHLGKVALLKEKVKKDVILKSTKKTKKMKIKKKYQRKEKKSKLIKVN